MDVKYEKLFTILSNKTFNEQLKWLPVEHDRSSSFTTMFTTETGQNYNVYLTYAYKDWIADCYVECVEFRDEYNNSLFRTYRREWSVEESCIIDRLIKEILFDRFEEVNEMERQSKEREKKERDERNMRKQAIVDELTNNLSLIVDHIS